MQFLLPLLTLISLSLLCGVKGWSPTNYEQFPINSLSSSLSLTKLGIGRPTNDIVSISSRRRWWNRNTSKTTRSKTKTRMLFNNNINKGNSLQQATKKTSSSSSSVAAERRVLTVVKSNLFSNRVTSSKRTTTTTTMLSSSATSTLQDGQNGQSSVKTLSKVPAAFVKAGMMAFIVSMCVALPLTLLPTYLLHKAKLISRVQKEQMSLATGQFCARWLLRFIPFCKLETTPYLDPNPQPAIWVCNHASSLDVFILLAADLRLRGTRKRPIKIVYWKGLEDNPITKLLFTQCGFIPVQMAANKAGEDNEYDLASFKRLLKQAKQAFEEGFDIGILPEGQLNPHPEEALLPAFPGAFTLARMSKRPIHMMALHGTHRLWHAREDIGMTVTGRTVKARVYPGGRKYSSGDEFLATFEAVIGEFAIKGKDLDDEELTAWITGKKWKEMQESA